MKIIIVVIIKCFWKNVHTNNTKMSFMIELKGTEGIDINKTNASKGCIICCYQYFLDKLFKLLPYVCNGFHNVFVMSINL